MAAPKRRGGSGRKKTVIRRIEQEDARQVSFAKRRVGFFTKASDLAVLTGAQVAALAFSPGGKAFTFGHPSVDSVVERFLAGEGLGAGAADAHFLAEDDKVRSLAEQLTEIGTELTEVNKQTERIDKTMAGERAAGDKIAAWVDPKVRDMGDEDMAAFFDALMQVKDIVSERARQVLLEAIHVDVSRMAETAPPLPPQFFGGSTFEYGSSSGSSNAGMEFQFLVPPPQGFPTGMDMQQQLVVEMPPAQGVPSGMDMQEMPPAQVVADGMVMQEMPPPPGFAAGVDMEQMQMTVLQPPSSDAGLDRELNQWLMAMLPPPPPEFPAGLEMAQQGLEPNAEEEEIHQFK